MKRLIPKEIEKGIYPRFNKLKDGSISLRWWVRVWKDGEPISQSAGSEKYSDAVVLKHKLIAGIVNGDRAGGRIDQVRIPEIIDDYLSECRVSEATLKEYGYSADGFIKPMLKTVKAAQLSTDLLNQYRKDRIAGIVVKRKPETLEQKERIKKSANTTVNRDFALLRAAMRHATRRTPPKVLRVPHFPMETEDNARQGFLDKEVYTKLRNNLKDPAVRLLFIVGYNIGCRTGELLQFEWSMVDLEVGVIRLPGRITKNKKPRTVPIFAGDYMDSMNSEKAQHDQLYPNSKWVFSRMGALIKDFRYDWAKACVSSGCPDLIFHDLRRTAVRNMTRLHGIDRATAKKISGHLTDSMFSRYDIIDEEDIKAAKRKVEANRTAHKQDFAASSDLFAKLATVPEEKLKALIALLGV